MITPNDFTRITNDTSGNPRYVCQYSNLLSAADRMLAYDLKYTTALYNARHWLGKKFHNKQYGGGIVFSTYNLERMCDEINAAINT